MCECQDEEDFRLHVCCDEQTIRKTNRIYITGLIMVGNDCERWVRVEAGGYFWILDDFFESIHILQRCLVVLQEDFGGQFAPLSACLFARVSNMRCG